MFNVSSLLKSFINPATLMQLAMGPAGWASLVAKTVMSAIGQQLIQKLGEQLGLPQSIIGLAQTAFSAASGTSGMPSSVGGAVAQLAQQFSLSPTDQGSIQRQLDDTVNNMASSLSQSKEFKEARAGGGKSWLMAIAEALGKQADKLSNELQVMSDKLGSGSKESQASDNLKFGAKSQEFSQFFNAANTVIKTIGEALGTGSRKQ
jgi:hypothetical protein